MFATILIVEDDPEMRQALINKLQKQHHEIIQAEDGEQGVAKFLSHRPDLMVLDLLLPKLDGFEVLQSLKQQMDLTKTPVVIYSNLNKPDSIERARNLNVSSYYVKAQTQIEELCQRIQDILQNQDNQKPKTAQIDAAG